MSKKVLKIASRRPILLALIIMATVTIGLLLSGWLTPAPGRAQPGQPDPDPGLEKCTNCVDGYVVLSAPTNVPAGCVGSPISMSVGGVTVNPAQVTIILTNKDGSTTNIASYLLNPTYNVTWIMSGVGANTNSGTGTTATFTPTNSGCGMVNFTAHYTNQSPCGGIGYSLTVTNIFSVGQLYTNCFDGAFHLGASASTTNLSFGPGANVSLSVTNNNYTNAIWLTTHYTCGTNVDTYGPTNFVRPTILSNWWTLTFGSLNTNGTGQSVSFTPTNGGCGSVTFNLTYKNNTPCDTNVHNASLALTFGVAQLSTNCTSGVVALGNSSATTNFCFGSVASLSVTNNNITNAIVVTTQWPSCSTNANTSVTNFVTPTVFSNRWTLTFGSFNTNGNGMSASFTPTNAGSGTVTFNEYYTNNTPCETNVHNTSIAIPFNVLLALNIVDGNGKPISSANSNNVVIVGQNITLNAQTANSCSETWSNYQWTVDGTTETNFYVSLDSFQTNGYPQPLTVTTNSSIFFYWVDAGTKTVICSAVCGGIPCSTNVTFTVLRPTQSVSGLVHNTAFISDSRMWMEFGPTNSYAMIFTNYLTMPPGTNYNNGNTNYSIRWVQLITSNPATITISNGVNNVVVHSCIPNGTVLDGTYPYPRNSAYNNDNIVSDAPSITCAQPNQIAASDTQYSKTWLMFKPDKGDWVPLWIVSWYCSGTTTGFGNNPANWSFSGEAGVVLISSADSGTTYPVWTDNAANTNSFPWNPPF